MGSATPAFLFRTAVNLEPSGPKRQEVRRSGVAGRSVKACMTLPLNIFAEVTHPAVMWRWSCRC